MDAYISLRYDILNIEYIDSVTQIGHISKISKINRVEQQASP